MLPIVMELVEPPLTAGLALFLVQLMVIIAVVRILGFLLSYVKEPAVIGEIVAGVVLGPSILGYIPGFSANLFPPSSIANIQTFANIGLILFLFFLGMEIEPGHLKRLWKPGAVIAVSSILVPFAVGSSLAVSLWTLEVEPKDYTSFILFIGTSFSFTAFPVLARILTANNLIAAQLGVQTLAAAALDDVLAWVCLAICLAYANGGSFVLGLATAGIATGFVLFELIVIRKAISYVYKYLLKRGRESDPNFVAAVFVLLFLSSWFAEIIGIHAFFGAFVFGLTIPRKGRFIADVSIRIELLVIHIFLPLYFAASGLRTSLGSLDSGELWGWCVLVSILGCLAKTLPVALASRFFYKEWSFCFSLGFLMNTRGLVALIALNIGLDRGILGVKIFTIMVIMALVNTFIAPPILYFLYMRNPFHPTPTALLPKKGLLKVAPGQIQAIELVEVGHGQAPKDEVPSVVVAQPAEQPVVMNGNAAGPSSPSSGVGAHPQMNGTGPLYPVSAVSPQSSHAFVYAAPPQNEVVDRRQVRGASPVNVLGAPASQSASNTPLPSPNIAHRKEPSSSYHHPNLPTENPADAALALALQRTEEEHHGRSRSASRSVTFDMTRPGYHLPLQLAQGAEVATEPPEPTDDEKQESYYHALHQPQVVRLNFLEGDPEEVPEDGMQLPSQSPTDTPLNQAAQGNVHVPSQLVWGDSNDMADIPNDHQNDLS